jgi:hypothetical protein
MFKIGNLENKEELFWNDIFTVEKYPTFSRIVIGCKSQEIPLILEFCKEIEGPFGVLHVLLVSRMRKESGRYQIPKPLSYAELESFLYEHREYFECDGRQHLWVSSVSGEGQFIYDNHNFIYAYGDIENHINKLISKGFNEGEIKIPAPHCHNYHSELDSEEDSVNNAFKWSYSPLRESDNT